MRPLAVVFIGSTVATLMVGCRSTPRNVNVAPGTTSQPTDTSSGSAGRAFPRLIGDGGGARPASSDFLASVSDLSAFALSAPAAPGSLAPRGSVADAATAMSPGPAQQAQNPGGDDRDFLVALCRGARDARAVAAEEWSMAALHLFTIANYGGSTCAGTIHVDALRRAQSYEPAPADRLVVISPRDVTEYRFERIEGDTSSLREFYNNQRAFVFVVFRHNAFHMRIATAKSQGSFQRRLSGAIAVARGVAEFDLLECGGSAIDHGHSIMQLLDEVNREATAVHVAVSHQAESSVRGRLAAAGGEIAVEEMFDGRIVNDVQQTRIAVASAGRRGNTGYQMSNVYFQHVERGGYPIERDYWRARGSLLRDGGAIGRSVFHAEVRPNYRAMQLADGTLLPM